MKQVFRISCFLDSRRQKSKCRRRMNAVEIVKCLTISCDEPTNEFDIVS